MGTTIRREPVTTSIPAAPDYRFLNITNFGGIEKSSNPFVVESNTASDCLNVYVDEDNALSTRPRLQRQTDFIKDVINKFPALGLTGAFDLIGVYDLHNGYLIHGVENNVYYMFKYIDKESIWQITGDNIPTEKCKIFEQSDVIYVLDGIKYRNIKDNVLSDVDVYVPTTKVGKNRRIKTTDDTIEYDTQGSDLESLNLLTDEYNESYFWSGVTDSTQFSNYVKVVNNYYKKYESSVVALGGTILTKYPDGTMLISKPDADSGYEIAYYYGVLNDNKTITLNELDFTESSTKPATVDPYTTNVKQLIRREDENLVIYEIDTKLYKFVKKLSFAISDYTSETIQDYGISSTGKYVWLIYTRTNGNRNLILLEITEDSVSNFEFSTHPLASYDDLQTVKFNKDDTAMYVWSLTNISGQNPRYTLRMGYDLANDKFHNNYVGSFSYDFDYGVYFDDYFNKGVIVNKHKDEWVVFPEPKLKNAYNVTMPSNSWIYFGNNFVAFLRDDDNTINIISDITDVSKYHNTYIVLRPLNWRSFIEFEDNSYILTKDGIIYIYDDATIPDLIVTRKLNPDDVTDERYPEWDKIRKIFLKSLLTTRFDNNTWFASNNYTFHTSYNNPTYIPLSSYNDLGEDFEPITGLSIVNDNILAAYKRNRIYIITPITVGNELTYSYTETKNIVGNDVIDAPILTILTEMPVIVSCDGIYALNQLENVQSSDRITTLISEAINPNWLKESSDDVNRCLTLNRLYWTYFILPHKKVVNGFVKDKDYTKIYLLDNRTQSWFYWELPIYVISAMVKNNKTHFVTQDGELYTLEITDLINKYNPDVTEYYDNLKNPTIIPWYWTSQILSLNTINYSKRLIDTTFVLTDTDTSDEYALNYKFKAFRKNKNAETTELTLTNDIEYVESITKRTMIPRFNFIQFTLSNVEDDTALNNNKLRLVGLGLKYVLLGGLY